MKTILNIQLSGILLGIMILASCQRNINGGNQVNPTEKEKLKDVSVQVNYSPSYCGGMRPNESVLAEATRERVYANQKLILVRQKSWDTVRVDSDENGNFSFKGNGKYQVFFPEKMKIFNSPNAKSKYCNDWKFTPDAFLNTDSANMFKLKLKRLCVPCEVPRQ